MRASVLLRSRESTPFKFKNAVKMESDQDLGDDKSSVLSLNTANVSITTQILMLYYILLYEHIRLTHMRTILASQRKVMRYSKELLSNLPIKFLLQTCEKDQLSFGVIFPQLLKLCSTEYPHLCLVQDWLDDEASSKDFGIRTSKVKRPLHLPYFFRSSQ